MKPDGFKPHNWGIKIWTDFEPKRKASGYQGTHQFKDQNGNKYGQFQIIWLKKRKNLEQGWYWFSIYLKNPLTGPFETSYMAYHDAVEQEVEQ